MELTVKQTDLAEALSALGRVSAPPNATYYFMSSVHLVAMGDTLSLTAGDLAMTLRLRIPAEVKVEGKATVPTRRLAALVGTLNLGSLILSLDEGDTTLRLSQGKTRAKVEGYAPEDFPPFPEYAGTPALTLPAPELAGALASVAFACAAPKDHRPILTGVYFDFAEEGKLVLVGCDGYQMAAHKLDLAEGAAEHLGIAEAKDIIIPATSIAELARSLPKDGTAGVHTNDRGQIAFVWPAGEFIASRIEGQYVPWSRMLAVEAATTAELPAARLAEFVRRALVFSDERANPSARFDLEAGVGLLRLATRQPGAGENVDECDVSAEGPAFTATTNLRHLSDMLGAIETESWAFQTRPGGSMIYRAGGYTYLTQPMAGVS